MVIITMKSLHEMLTNSNKPLKSFCSDVEPIDDDDNYYFEDFYWESVDRILHPSRFIKLRKVMDRCREALSAIKGARNKVGIGAKQALNCVILFSKSEKQEHFVNMVWDTLKVDKPNINIDEIIFENEPPKDTKRFFKYENKKTIVYLDLQSNRDLILDGIHRSFISECQKIKKKLGIDMSQGKIVLGWDLSDKHCVSDSIWEYKSKISQSLSATILAPTNIPKKFVDEKEVDATDSYTITVSCSAVDEKTGLFIPKQKEKYQVPIILYETKESVIATRKRKKEEEKDGKLRDQKVAKYMDETLYYRWMTGKETLDQTFKRD